MIARFLLRLSLVLAVLSAIGALPAQAQWANSGGDIINSNTGQVIVSGGGIVSNQANFPLSGNNGLLIGVGPKNTPAPANGGHGCIRFISDDPVVAGDEFWLQVNFCTMTGATFVERRAKIECIEQHTGPCPITLNENGGGVGIGLAQPCDGCALDIKTPQGTALIQHGLQTGIVQYWAGFKPNDYNYYMGTGGSSPADLGRYGVYLTNQGNSWISVSDARLKKNITPSPYGLDAVLKLKPVTAQWKGSDAEGKFLTLLAQQVQEVIPEAVHRGAVTKDAPDGQLGVDYPALVMPLIAAVQEMSKRLQLIESRPDDHRSK